MQRDKFEPRIIGFLCNWCAYAGADLAEGNNFASVVTEFVDEIKKIGG